MSSIPPEELARMAEYRRIHFDAKIETDTSQLEPGDFVLSLTHNGHQWTSILLNKREADFIIRVLLDAIKQ